MSIVVAATLSVAAAISPNNDQADIGEPDTLPPIVRLSNHQVYGDDRSVVRSLDGDALVVEPRLQFFVVECRQDGGRATRFFLPALNADEAIISARKSAHNLQQQDPTAPDPFERSEGLEIRVGTFDPSDPTEIIFGDWSLTAS
jgi:hypothetical protein